MSGGADPARSRSGVHPIEAESYRILDERVDLSGWPPGDREVVARVVHATADVSFAETMRIGPDAVTAATAALEAGGAVVVDSAMVAAGIPQVRARCFLADVPIAPEGSTRSAAAIDVAARHHPEGALWVVGNAPTALARLLELHRAGSVAPAAVVGLPVGFVGAAAAKLALWEGPLAPVAVTNLGERGGSPAAAAAVNALRRLLQERKTPDRVGPGHPPEGGRG